MSSSQSDRRAEPEHYLLLVNTAVAFQMNEEKFRQFDKSFYDGLAVAFLHAYDTSEVPSAAQIATQLKDWKKLTSKDLWPWVYINRMLGMSPEQNNYHSDQPYFRKIKGADLDDDNRALTDFLKIWRNSLAAARAAGEPGIVCDLEFYNYYKEYDIGELARQAGKTPADTADKLKKIGARMADIAAEEYPGAVLWFLFTAFTHPGYKTYDGVPYYPSPAYIAMGLLDEIAAKKSHLKVLAGGEGSLGYWHVSLDDLRESIRRRESDVSSQLKRDASFFELAGTMTLWRDRNSPGLRDGNCKTVSAGTVEELQPYLELLLTTYRYNWIYGTADNDYLAFSAGSAARFNAMIQRARANTSAGRGKNPTH